jgi:hypothetical protein
MTPDESLNICRLAKALSPAQAMDEYTPEAWAVVLRDVSFKDAETALEQLGGEQEWIHVSHIVKRVKRIRDDRVKKHFANVQPPSGLSDAEYSDWYARTVKAIANGDYEPEPPARIEGHRDVIRELGQAQSIDTALAAKPSREALERARLDKQAADADRKRAEDQRRAELERMRLEDQAARDAIHAAKGGTDTEEAS